MRLNRKSSLPNILPPMHDPQFLESFWVRWHQSPLPWFKKWLSMNSWISSSEANLEIKLSLNSSPMHDPFVWPYTLQYETKLLGPWPTLVLSISLSQLTPARVKVRVRRIGAVALALVVRGWLSADLPLRPPLLSRLRPRPLRSVIVGRWKTDEEDDEEADRKFRPVHFFGGKF